MPGRYFWRVSTAVEGQEPLRSPTWLFRVRANPVALDSFHGRRTDLDGDGYSDVVLPDRRNWGVMVLFGSPTGLEPVRRLGVPPHPSGEQAMVWVGPAMDNDGDGLSEVTVSFTTVDLLLRDESCYIARYRLVAPERDLRWADRRCPPSPGELPGELGGFVGDFDGDGYDDTFLRVTFWGGIPLPFDWRLFRGGPEGLATMYTRSFGDVFDNGPGVSNITSNINGDRYEDTLVGTANYGGPNEIAVFLGASETPLESVVLRREIPLYTRPPAMVGNGDFNGDGFTDILIRGPTILPGQQTQDHQILDGSAEPDRGAFRRVTFTAPLLYAGGGFGFVGDLDADGRDDLLYRSSVAPLMEDYWIFRGSPAGLTTTPVPIARTPHISLGVLRSSEDYNGDGRDDCVGEGWPGAGPRNFYALISEPGTPLSYRAILLTEHFR